MPVAYRELDLDQVKAVLFRRGYGPSSGGSFALTFNKPTGKVFSTGVAERKPLPGVTQKQLDTILRFAEDVEDAANRIERIMLGQSTGEEPTVNAEALVRQQGLSPTEVDALVTARVQTEVARLVGKHTEQISEWLGEVRQELLKLFTKVAKLESSSPKKPGRPLGSKNKPKRQEADEEAIATSLPKVEVDEHGEPKHY